MRTSLFRVERRHVVMLVASASLVALAIACKGSTTDCNCPVEQNGERRTLACGETACVGGVTVACGGDQTVATRGACTEQQTPPPPPAGGDAGGTPPPPDTSCDDLRAFCTSSCNAPAGAASDCLSTASAGDPTACKNWQSANSVLCRP